MDVPGEKIVDSWRKVISSKYTPEALAYRIHSGLGDEETTLAVLVVEMINAKSSEVLYTSDPAGNQTKNISIHAVRGQAPPLSVVVSSLNPTV